MSEAAEQFPRCGQCGGKVTLLAKRGRTRKYRVLIVLPIPDDFLIPTCESCGDEFMDLEISEKLDTLLIQQLYAKTLLGRPYARVFIPEELGGFSARMQEFPGCFAQGETLQEAYENLERAAESWLLATMAAGNQPPEPLLRQAAREQGTAANRP